MKLPNVHLGIIEQAKICDYLLNETHRFGFTLEAWEELAIALKKHGEENEVARIKHTGFGPR